MKKGKTVFWMIFILSLIATVLTITFVGLFGKKSTTELASDVNSYTTSGYLASTGEQYTKINAYVDGLDTSEFGANEKKEVLNFQNAYKAFVAEGFFFNRQLYFMTYTKTYKNNRKTVENALKNANNLAKEIVSLIEKNKSTTEGSSYWAHMLWINMKGKMKDFVSYSVSAFNILSNIYKDSVESDLLNNSYSDVMFLCMNNLHEELMTGYEETDGVGLALRTFAEIYFTTNGEQEILEYTYLDKHASKREKVEDIKAKNKDSVEYEGFLTHMPI